MNDKKTTILALSWRDIRSPGSGGAEVNTHNMLKTLDFAKYRVIHLSPLYEGLKEREQIDNIEYIRKGGIISVILFARRFYKKHSSEIDIIIEQCNTHRFFAPLWTPRNKRIFLIYQLTREIWDINMKFPFNKIGYYLENHALRLNRHDVTITESMSTKQDLVEIGFERDKVHIIPIGIDERILSNQIDEAPKKNNSFVYVGRYSKYKGINAAIEALGMIRKKHNDAVLRIVGKKDEEFIENVINPIARKYNLTVGDEGSDVVLCGFVDEERKFDIMRDSKALIFPSVREGWGIIVTEAAALGTPSIVYNSPGARDAVDFGRAGYLCKDNTPEDIARLMIEVIEDESGYHNIRMKAKEFSNDFSWIRNKDMLSQVIDEVVNG